jgi:hypothetical protein
VNPAIHAEPDAGRIVDLLERLVAIDTQNPPGREAEAAALLATELDGMGFATEMKPLAEGRANIVARLDNGPGPCFAFNSRMDTVPVGVGWTSGPFRLTERNGRLFARGEFLAALPPERWTVVTSAPRALARARLSAAQLPVPDTLVSGEDVTEGKPAPDCWLLGAKRLGWEAADCLVFEDSAAGIRSALAADAELVVIASAQAHASLPGSAGLFTVTDYQQLKLTVGLDRLCLEPRRTAVDEAAAPRPAIARS